MSRSLSPMQWPRWTPLAALLFAFVLSIGLWFAAVSGVKHVVGAYGEHGWSREQIFAATRDALPIGRSALRR